MARVSCMASRSIFAMTMPASSSSTNNDSMMTTCPTSVSNNSNRTRRKLSDEGVNNSHFPSSRLTTPVLVFLTGNRITRPSDGSSGGGDSRRRMESPTKKQAKNPRRHHQHQRDDYPRVNHHNHHHNHHHHHNHLQPEEDDDNDCLEEELEALHQQVNFEVKSLTHLEEDFKADLERMTLGLDCAFGTSSNRNNCDEDQRDNDNDKHYGTMSSEHSTATNSIASRGAKGLDNMNSNNPYRSSDSLSVASSLAKEEEEQEEITSILSSTTSSSMMEDDDNDDLSSMVDDSEQPDESIRELRRLLSAAERECEKEEICTILTTSSPDCDDHDDIRLEEAETYLEGDSRHVTMPSTNFGDPHKEADEPNYQDKVQNHDAATAVSVSVAPKVPASHSKIFLEEQSARNNVDSSMPSLSSPIISPEDVNDASTHHLFESRQERCICANSEDDFVSMTKDINDASTHDLHVHSRKTDSIIANKEKQTEEAQHDNDLSLSTVTRAVIVVSNSFHNLLDKVVHHVLRQAVPPRSEKHRRRRQHQVVLMVLPAVAGVVASVVSFVSRHHDHQRNNHHGISFFTFSPSAAGVVLFSPSGMFLLNQR